MNCCKICGNAVENRSHTAREMMFGSGDQFTYLECGKCGCLQLLNVPTDISKYYPKEYYSFKKHGKLTVHLRRKWSAHALGRPSIVGWLLDELYFPNRAILAVRRSGVSRQSRILDVGCGAGNLLADLQYLGFEHLTGADAFIESDLRYGSGLTIFKKHLQDMPGTYDLVMMHHSLEHMEAPSDVLRALERLLAPSGQAVVRLPLASSYAWRKYGVDWVALDAPRHLYLHTYRSIDILAERAGLVVSEVVQETDDGTFWASEAYAKGIAMNDKRFPNSTLWKRIAGWPRNRRLRDLASRINKNSEADMVCFYLKKREQTHS